MNIANFRVDDRLVHGIVATNWVPTLGIQRIIVIDGDSAENPMLKNALRMATPKTVNLSVIKSDKAISNLLEKKYGSERIMLIVKTPKTIIELLDAGITINKLVLGNLGNIVKTEDTIPITRFVSVNKVDKNLLEIIHERGVKIVSQLVPKDEEVDFMSLMKKKINN